MNYHSDRELQDYFDSASAICFEAFPKQTYGDYFTKEQKGTCQSYIPHGIHLAFEFANLHRADARGTVKGYVEKQRFRDPWLTSLRTAPHNLSVFCLIAHGISSKPLIMNCVSVLLTLHGQPVMTRMVYSTAYFTISRAQPTMSSTS